MPRQRHTDFDRNARIGIVGRQATADAVRNDMSCTGCFECTALAVVILAHGQVLARMIRGGSTYGQSYPRGAIAFSAGVIVK